MHELSVTESLLDISLRYAERASARRITDLYLVVGQLASIIDDSVQFYWDIISKGTIADGAHLHFRRIPTMLHCLDCGHQYHPVNNELACPICNSQKIKIIAGEEFFLESIDVDSPG